MKYRKKPVVIEAVQLNERCLIEEDWFWDAVTRNEIIIHDGGKWSKNPAWCEIKTLEGVMVAKQAISLLEVYKANFIRASLIFLQKHTKN
nr:MAG TPA: PGDYG protein [Caudoviricetes sp.]